MRGFEGFLAETIERVNAAWWILDLWLVGFLLFYFYVGYRDSRLNTKAMIVQWWDGRMPIYLQAAAAILVFHVGDFGVRFSVWWLRHVVNSGGGPVGIQDWSTYWLLIFAFVAGVGMLCQLRVFAGLLLGRWIWIWGGCAALLAALFTRIIP